MKTLLKNVLHEGRKRDILVSDGHFLCTDLQGSVDDAEVFDAEGLAILPAFYNTHTHAAMSLVRGYADDMPLKPWLEEWIWPYEDKLTAKDIREGSRIAVREMIGTGTVFFNDMYFEIDQTEDVVGQAGMRASIGVTVMDNHSLSVRTEKEKIVSGWQDKFDGRVTLAVAPHAIYTVGTDNLRRAAKMARDKGLRLHIHLSETTHEVSECVAKYGTTPVRYLDSIGFLGPDVIAAHCVHVDEEEWDILASRGVTVAHCPCSNMKLGSGRFPYELAIRSGARITIGTDGCSSNNNLDMREEMKFAALLAKVGGDPSLLPAHMALDWATRNGAEAFGIDGGVIADGKVADAILVDLSDKKMQPCHNLVSNWVYSADSSCIRKVMCDGKFIL